MALTTSNTGFRTSRPSATTADNSEASTGVVGLKVTSPAGTNNLTEIGWLKRWYSSTGTFRVAIYSHDAANDRPGNQLAVSSETSIPSGADSWAYAAVSYSLAASTTYWFVVLRTTPDDCELAYDFVDTLRSTFLSASSLPSPWSSGSTQYDDVLVGLYGLYTAASTTYTLTCDAGSFAITGISSDLLYSRLVSAGPGSFAITGTDASLLYSRVCSTDTGTFAINGTACSLLYSHALAAGSGAFAITGIDASLLYSRIMSADAGAFSITGTDIGLLYSRLLNATSGAFAITGSDASLLYSRILVANGGTFAFSGYDVDLLYNRLLSADGGSFVITGTDAQLIYTTVGSYVLVCNSGTFDITGADADLLTSRILQADPGTISITGLNADLLYNRSLLAESGAFLFVGNDATLTVITLGPAGLWTMSASELGATLSAQCFVPSMSASDPTIIMSAGELSASLVAFDPTPKLTGVEQ
jgi:hypothetical protein